MESRMRGDMQVRFGGRYEETYCRKAARRLVPSLRAATGGDLVELGKYLYQTESVSEVLAYIGRHSSDMPLPKVRFQALPPRPVESDMKNLIVVP